MRGLPVRIFQSIIFVLSIHLLEHEIKSPSRAFCLHSLFPFHSRADKTSAQAEVAYLVFWEFKVTKLHELTRISFLILLLKCCCFFVFFRCSFPSQTSSSLHKCNNSDSACEQRRMMSHNLCSCIVGRYKIRCRVLYGRNS